MRQVAMQAYHKAHYAAQRIASLKGYAMPKTGTFAYEFPVSCPIPAGKINIRLLEKGIIGGLDIGDQMTNGMLVCVTEMITSQEIDTLVDVLAEFQA